jgi:hypothetical protein
VNGSNRPWPTSILPTDRSRNHGLVSGIKTAGNATDGVHLTRIDDGDYLCVRSVDFGKGAKQFKASLLAPGPTAGLKSGLNGVDGTLLGTCTVDKDGKPAVWSTASCRVEKIKGIHDLYLVFKGSGAFVPSHGLVAIQKIATTTCDVSFTQSSWALFPGHADGKLPMWQPP